MLAVYGAASTLENDLICSATSDFLMFVYAGSEAIAGNREALTSRLSVGLVLGLLPECTW
jgi:hypothetical protein